VGDALGLSYEGMSPSRARKLLGPPERYRFVFGRGMISDDTEHTCMVAQSLIESGDNVDTFTRRFASRLRWWILALPAGVGNATARSCIKLWLGIRPAKSGVYSAGNGPAMRAAIFGATIDDVPKLLEYVRASSRLTLPQVVFTSTRSMNATNDGKSWFLCAFRSVFSVKSPS